MAADYAAICAANKVEYGNVQRWGPGVLVNRYDSSAHFIFELLQNAEDALARRDGWQGSKSVHFDLAPQSLRVHHSGNPFTLADVKGVCGIAETTKNLTEIGRFGIGFKSVYAITDRPEVHSGAEDFAIENFVFPVAASPTNRYVEHTEFVLPLRAGDGSLFPSIAESLGKLGARALLFLRRIEEISWTVASGANGIYMRSKGDEVGPGCRRVSLIGERGGVNVEETWLVFAREARRECGELAGFIEVAFLLHRDEETGADVVQRVDASPLYAFFPTVVSTHLGFLVQGPYRTTPSRDNIPPEDPWNLKLIRATAGLLVDAVRELKAQGLLDVAALQTLPIDKANFPSGSMFAPLFEAMRDALATEPLLPCADGGWTAAKNARLARTQELRELFDAEQLAALLGETDDVHWLSGDITRDTTPALRQYVLTELNISELTPEMMLARLDKAFLEAQSDAWILKLYEFLGGQPALLRGGRVAKIPLVRVAGGGQVVADADGQPQAFLPSDVQTDFPTVPRSVCSTEKSLAFLKALGLSEPDIVDDVVRNVVPKYLPDTVSVEDDEYAADIQRMVAAFATEHTGQRKKLVTALAAANIVMSVDASDGEQHVSTPDQVYLATERLMALFDGVAGVMLVDSTYECLKGEDVRELLEACGAVRYPRPVAATPLTASELAQLREQEGHARTSGVSDRVVDAALGGLDALLAMLPTLAPAEQRKRAGLLWEELVNLEDRSGKRIFMGKYTWSYYGSHEAAFDAAFVRQLNETAWVPDADGNLQHPEFVLFDSLGWRADPFLQSRIRFRPPILNQLAEEAGIEPGTLDLLKRLGLTSEAELRQRLGVTDEAQDANGAAGEAQIGNGTGTVGDALGALGITNNPTPPVHDPSPSTGPHGGATGGDSSTSGGGHGTGTGTAGGKRTPGSKGGRPFISYVGVHPDDEDDDPDGLDQEQRMALEGKAIAFILFHEPVWQRTPAFNPGFDLFQTDTDGKRTQWCEVKSMTGSLHDRPVGMSHTQFECAREHRAAFWLYVVEYAGTNEARIVRIQDPASNARTFTFDHGWLDIAVLDSNATATED